ncbi:hypothetical protein BDN72DRAFT_906321 [Pluteus cervinus]|uniref:Uncharacterized protein n=1 Tax=Pluteus cervinus TaxID=181527 RepID=A0ACD2ZZR0_9AGAR|nr:hypothetical protein BDN72DRAFT_906321 [Pluteus cervinus]
MSSQPPALIPEELFRFYQNLKKIEGNVANARNKIEAAGKLLTQADDVLVDLDGYLCMTRKRVALAIDQYHNTNTNVLVASSTAGAFAADVAKLIAHYDILKHLLFTETCLNTTNGPPAGEPFEVIHPDPTESHDGGSFAILCAPGPLIAGGSNDEGKSTSLFSIFSSTNFIIGTTLKRPSNVNEDVAPSKRSRGFPSVEGSTFS